MRDTTTAVQSRPFLVLVRRLKLPSALPRFKIAQITFPALGFDFRLPSVRRGETRLQLERLGWRMTDLAIDPSDSSAAARPLFSRNIELFAENFVMHPDSLSALSVGVVASNVSDSTLELHDVSFKPTLSPSEFARVKRRAYIAITAGQGRADGIDFGALALGYGMIARRLAVDSSKWGDRNQGGPRRLPACAARLSNGGRLDQSVSFDSIVLT